VVEFPKPKQDVYRRLQHLYTKVSTLLPVPPDILVIEEVHKALSGSQLQWAIGTSIAAAKAPVTFELPINVWKALAKTRPGYAKSDTADAELILDSLIELARRK
jgi:Holliday junction resolvasome RuvABC endonuclease subunit